METESEEYQGHSGLHLHFLILTSCLIVFSWTSVWFLIHLFVFPCLSVISRQSNNSPRKSEKWQMFPCCIARQLVPPSDGICIIYFNTICCKVEHLKFNLFRQAFLRLVIHKNTVNVRGLHVQPLPISKLKRESYGVVIIVGLLKINGELARTKNGRHLVDMSD